MVKEPGAEIAVSADDTSAQARNEVSALALPESPDFSESITEQLIVDPALRYRVRAALSTFSIEPYKNLALGYTRRPVVDMNRLCEVMGATLDPESWEGETVARAFLEGCDEFRDDVDFVMGYSKELNPAGLKTFAQLPRSLQLLGAFKVIDRIDPGNLFTQAGQRARMKAYFVNRLGAPADRAEDVLRSAAIIFADKIMWEHILGMRGADLGVSGLPRGVLVGPVNPRTGIQLGADLELGLAEVLTERLGSVSPNSLLDQKRVSRQSEEEREHFENLMAKVIYHLDNALQIAGHPGETHDKWRGYLFAKSISTMNFRPLNRFGFDTGIDQLAHWKEPLADNEYPERQPTLNKWLRVAEEKLGMDVEGINLARQSFALELIDQLEQEIAANNVEQSRAGRIKVVSKLVSDIETIDPELALTVMESSPVLRHAIAKGMDPWGYKYR